MPRVADDRRSSGVLPDVFGSTPASVSASGRQLPQGPLEIWEVPSAERLDPGVMVPIEPGDCPGTPPVHGGHGRVEPQDEMERMDRLGCRVPGAILERGGACDAAGLAA